MRRGPWALAGLLLILAAASGAAAPAPGLVGTWQLVSFEDKPASGPAVVPFGPAPKGLLIYDASGHMSLQIMRNPGPRVASGNETKITPEEKLALFDAYVAYFGRYSVDAAKGVVVHHVEGDFYNVYVGRDEVRPFTLTGDRLVLRPTWTVGNEKWVGTRVFQRLTAKSTP
jgi:hypothetical protein